MQVQLAGIEKKNSQDYLVKILAGTEMKKFLFTIDTESKIPRFDPEASFFDFFGSNTGL
jgi:hypothetical protein